LLHCHRGATRRCDPWLLLLITVIATAFDHLGEYHEQQRHG
jgi:hypothetical protein